MNINKMSRTDFKSLPEIEEKITKFDSIVLIPTSIKHQSGYSLFSVIACLREEPIGRVSLYDTFRFEFEDGGIDCLSESNLMRIFFQEGRYELNPHFHSIKIKK